MDLEDPWGTSPVRASQVIAGSRRPDGTYRKPVRVRAGEPAQIHLFLVSSVSIWCSAVTKVGVKTEDALMRLQILTGNETSQRNRWCFRSSKIQRLLHILWLLWFHVEFLSWPTSSIVPVTVAFAAVAVVASKTGPKLASETLRRLHSSRGKLVQRPRGGLPRLATATY